MWARKLECFAHKVPNQKLSCTCTLTPTTGNFWQLPNQETSIGHVGRADYFLDRNERTGGLPPLSNTTIILLGGYQSL